MKLLAAAVWVGLVACGDGAGAGEVRTVAVAEGRLWAPRFAPAGDALAVAFGPDDKIGTIALATTTLTEVATGGSYLTGTAWSAAGDAIYYSGAGGVFRVVPGGAATPVNDAFAALGLDLSPEGGRLAYGTNGSNARLYTIATATETALDRPCQAIRFAPSGAEVACVSGGALVTIDLATGVATEVIASGLPFIAGVDWYADGQRLVVTSDDGLEAVTRGGARTLLHDTFAAVELDLAPDERSLVFVTNGSAALSIVAL